MNRSPILTTIRYVLLTALRDKLFTGMLGGVIAAAYISSVMGSTALVETQAMTVTYAAGVARLILVMGLTVFVCFHIRNAFDTREIDVMLSRPITRYNLVLSYWLGFAGVALLLVVPVALILTWLSAFRDAEGHWHLLQGAGLLAWTGSMLLESFLVVALALFAAFTLRSGVSAVMATLGFYVLSRMMGFFVITMQSGMLFREQEVNIAAKWLLTVISVVIPRLDFFAKTDWLVNALKSPQEITLYVIQAAVFIPVLVIAAMADFKRKQF